MIRFPRRRRMKVGRFVAPPEAEPATLERLVDEGLLIVAQAMRMTLKNAIIVAALRDRTDLDREALSTLAVARAEELIGAELDAASRDHEQSGAAPRRREQVRRALAASLQEHANDAEWIADVVERARLAAWEEIAGPMADRAAAEREAERAIRADLDPQDRAERVAAFLALDLSELAAERGVNLHD